MDRNLSYQIEYLTGSDGEWEVLLDALQDAKPSEIRKPFTVEIPLEYPNPVANLLVFDIDEGGQCTIVSEGSFTFEVVSDSEYYDKDRTARPVTSYNDGWISMNMSQENTCELIVHIQEEPYTDYSRHLIFYKSDNSVIEHFILIVGENSTAQDWCLGLPWL